MHMKMRFVNTNCLCCIGFIAYIKYIQFATLSENIHCFCTSIKLLISIVNDSWKPSKKTGGKSHAEI
jgi:hypothetical protein